jgi:hypothetical protein
MLVFSGAMEAVMVASTADLAWESNFGPKSDQATPPATAMQAKPSRADPIRLFPELLFAMFLRRSPIVAAGLLSLHHTHETATFTP